MIRRTRQQGFSLFVSLIMLVLMTLLAITAFHLSTSQTVVVANAQHKNEAIAAATQAIEIVLNSSNFTQNPSAAIPNTNCTTGVGSNTWCVDTNGDGTQDISVTLPTAPRCVTAAPIPMSQLNLQNTNDLACTGGTQQNFGIGGTTTTSNSLCANSTWEVVAQATDIATETSVTVTQGVYERIATTDMTNYCP